MLHHFITAHREQLVKLTREKITQRTSPRPVEEELQHGVPLFLDQIIRALQFDTARAASAHQQMGEHAARHGQDMLRRGFTVSQLVHDYGAVCQAITQLASEQGAAISAQEYRRLNSFLDDAIAEAVTGYGQQREQVSEVDRQLLESAVANLVQNAFKFTHPKGHVALRTRTREGLVLIEVEDECGGLPPGKTEELFRPFEQRGGDRSGLGLGLAITRQSIHANGGELSVQNLPGVGCIFTIALPLVTAASSEEEAGEWTGPAA